MSSTIVISGGSGFIGSKIAVRAQELGYDVTNLDLVDRKLPGIQSRICDIRNAQEVIKNLPKGTIAILHLAGLTSVLQSKLDPQGVFETNVVGTHNLLEAARITGVENFIFASTNAVVGNSDVDQIDEYQPLNPLTPYGATKAAGEMLLSSYAGSYDLRASSLRLTNVYGIDMFSKDSIMPRIMRALLGGKPLEIYGDGEQWRDFIFASDVVDAFFLALDRKITGPLTIGAGKSFTVREIIQTVARVTTKEVPFVIGPAKVGEMRGVRVNIGKAKDLGFAPKISLEDGVAALWNDFCAVESNKRTE